MIINNPRYQIGDKVHLKNIFACLDNAQTLALTSSEGTIVGVKMRDLPSRMITTEQRLLEAHNVGWVFTVMFQTDGAVFVDTYSGLEFNV